ncbi:hypothetical protein [Streptomyces calvus]|uniref:Uncharacterized protein n=1 Tax=Streptomyces calvus TaxID=67282 RepID=A0AA40VHA7_9ACTN|nr:hypothetical protein [Streptomyces calvus]MBA8945525.1 hypothetical protein [Streptomyces calvus]GGP59742.1 hypothetical protein GCM10010247_35540 [Streptomyces calvus]
MSERDDRDKKPATAAEEVLREVEEAARRTRDSDERHHRGEAGDTVTPNTHAQEQAKGE